MHILVTGADGMLGSSLVPLLEKNHEVIVCTHKVSYGKFTHLDITDHDSVTMLTNKYPIDCIVHLAAITNVDYCEDHIQETMKVNFRATDHMVSLCRKKGIYLVFLSSGAVFSGKKKNPYGEKDLRNPINVYGLSKKKAEDCVKKLPAYCIVRTGWLIGGGNKDHKFVSFMLRQINQNKKTLHVVSDNRGSPTFTDDLAEAISRMISLKVKGIYHVVNKGIASRFDIVSTMLGVMDKKVNLVPVGFGFFHEKAFRPQMEGLSSYALEKKYRIILPDWKKSLSEYLHRKYGKK